MLRYSFCRDALIWLGVFAVALLVMVRPAHAVVESVAPISGGKTWCARSSGCYWSPQITFNTVSGACNRYMNELYRDMFYTLVSGDTYYCKAYRISDGVQVNLDYADLAGSTPATCPTATPAYTYNSVTNMCERTIPDCPAFGTSAGAYWINTGIVPDSLYKTGLGIQCFNGCQTEGFSAVVTPSGNGNAEMASKVVAGVRNYFSKRYFYYTGQICTGNTQPSTDAVPNQQTCAPGQSFIQLGERFKCIDPATGADVSVNSASAVAAAYTLANIRSASAVAAAQAAAQAAGFSASGVESAQSVAAGVAAAGGTGDNSANPDPVMKQFCQDNPTASICVEQDFGSVDDATLGEKSISVAINPVSVGGAGSCPAPSAMVLHGQTYYFQWTTYCNFANGIKPILLAFAWLSAAGLLVGGFRTA